MLLSLPPCPVEAGDVVHVPEPDELDSGRRVRKGHYDVLDAEATPPEFAHLGRYRLTVEARLDCSNLPETHQRGSAYRTSRQLDDVPACARPTRVYLYPGDFTRYAAGDGPAKVHDHPLQTT